MQRPCSKDSKDIAFIHLRLLHAFFPQTVATLGVLTVAVKARCFFEVVSSVSGKFGDPYSTKVPSSSVFEGSLARNGVLGGLFSEELDLLKRHARFLSYVHSVRKA